MSAPKLNVRVGLLFDQKALATLERQMRASGQRLSKIGTELSLSLSLPLSAFGVTAIKAAGDIESLTLALKSQLGTADAAAKELDLLTEAAKNPGLGVEQAVRGSVRLQGVGFAAEEARQVLIQMGNAIAATGGSAQELDNVTRQFAQMTSKGSVLQEDISVLSENMPGLAQLMQKAFGTANVDAIREMGISGKEFVKQITKAAETLPRVEGGIKNGIGNAIDSLKQSAAKVGFAINEAFDVTGAIETVSSAVLALAQGFSSLDPFLKKTILGIAGIAIATGPLIKAWGAMKLLSSQMVSLWGGIVSVGKSVVAGLQAMRAAFFALNAATQAFLLIGILTAVTALAVAFSNYQSELTDAEKAQQSLTSIQKQASDSIQGQKSEVDTLVAAYKAEGATLKQKTEILNRLNQISPEYFGGLRAGKGDVDALTAATAAYGAQLLNVAELSSLNKRLEQIATDLRDISKAADPSALQTIGNVILAGGNSLLFASKQAKTFANNSNELRDSLLAEQSVLQARATELALGAAATGDLTDKYKDLGGASDEVKNKLKTLKSVLKDVANAAPKAALIGDDESAAKIDALRKGIEKLVDAGFKPASKEVTDLKTQLDALTEKPQEIVIDIIQNGQPPTIPTSNQPNRPGQPPTVPVGETDEEKTLREAFEYAKEAGVSEKFLEIAENIGLGAIAIRSLSDGLVTMAEQAGPAFDGLAGSLFGLQGAYTRTGAAALAAASQMVKAALASTLSTAIQDSFKKAGNPLLGIALAGIAVAGVNALFGKIQQSLSKTPKFARGTKNAPGGVALVGEQGPELVNLPRGSQVFPTPKTNQMLSGLGGGGVSVSGEFTVKGTDLVLVLERTQNKNQRFR